MDSLKLKPSEVLILLFAFLLFFSASYVYIRDVPLQRYIFGNRFEETQEQIGKLTIKNGTIKRKTTTQNSFEPIEISTDLYNYDTIVTAPDSTATITLKDGSAIELSPKTMIKLVFDSQLSLGGISRSRTIDVVAGQVSGQTKSEKIILKSKEQTVALSQSKPKETIKVTLPPIEVTVKKPVPTPVVTAAPTPVVVPTPMVTPVQKSQVILAATAPEDRAKLAIRDGSTVAERNVDFSWKVAPENTLTRLVVKYRLPSGGTKEVFYEKIEAQGNDAHATVTLKRPGVYQWEVLPVTELELPAKKFLRTLSLDANFRSITVQKPIVGKLPTEGEENQIQKDFGILLKWTPFADAENYTIRLVANENDKTPILEKTLKDTEFEFNKDKVFNGNFYYTVRAKTSYGFNVLSNVGKFSYRFEPPALVRPEPDTTISQQELDQQENRILFTWKKTQFTEAYLLEFSLEKSFAKVVLSKKTRENFFILKAPPNGSYWWRVRSVAGKGVVSDPSTPYQIVVKRTNPTQKSADFDESN